MAGELGQPAHAGGAVAALAEQRVAIEFDAQHGEAGALAARAQRVLQRQQEAGAVGQVGELVDAAVARLARHAGAMRVQLAKREHAADRPAVAPLRLRVALDHRAVDLGDLVARLGQRVGVDILQPPVVGIDVHHVHAHPVVHAAVVVRMQHAVGQRPHAREAAVERPDAAVQVGDEDGVGRGLERGAQLGQRRLAFELDAMFAAAIAHLDQKQRRAVRQPDRCDAARDGAPAATGKMQFGVAVEHGDDAAAHAVPVGHVLEVGDRVLGVQAFQVAALQQLLGLDVGREDVSARGVDDPGCMAHRGHGREDAGEGLRRRDLCQLRQGRSHAAASSRSSSRGALSTSKKYEMRWRGFR